MFYLVDFKVMHPLAECLTDAYEPINTDFSVWDSFEESLKVFESFKRKMVERKEFVHAVLEFWKVPMGKSLKIDGQRIKKVTKTPFEVVEE